MRKDRFVRIFALAICALLLSANIAQARGKTLPKAAKEAIKEAFPEAKIGDVDSEREFGILYYEVEIRENGRKKEVEVSAEGIIGEIEYKIKPSELPKNLRGIVRNKIKGGKILRIEKHERRGSARSGKWKQLPTPTIMYDVKFSKNGKKSNFIIVDEIAIGSDPEDPVESVDDEDDADDDHEDEQEIDVKDLPDVIKISIQKTFPKGKLEEASVETEDGVQVFEVEVSQGDKEYEVELNSEGRILEISEDMQFKDLPIPVRQTLMNRYAKSFIKELERKYIGDKIIYEVELKTADKELEITLDPKGIILSSKEADD